MTKLVTIIVADIRKYRPIFYIQLFNVLKKNGVDLKVIYSDPSLNESVKNDTGDLDYPLGTKVARFYFLNGRILLQLISPVLIAKSDLIIIVPSNGYLFNYFLLILNFFNIKKIAFWGHPFNHQSNPNSILEKFKRLYTSSSFWWFTYTVSTKKYLQVLKYPDSKITVVENAIDTMELSRQISSISEEMIFNLKLEMRLPSDSFVAIFCGSLYPNKQLEFLIEAGKKLFLKNSKFRLLIVGDGPQKNYIKNVLENNHWLIYCGAKFGLDRAKYFAISDVFLNPGLVGLSILDSFAAGLPFIATQYKGHSPEIAYLESGVNGLLLPFSVNSYVNEIDSLIGDVNLLAKLKVGAHKSGIRYTIENMVDNVYKGIMKCL